MLLDVARALPIVRCPPEVVLFISSEFMSRPVVAGSGPEVSESYSNEQSCYRFSSDLKVIAARLPPQASPLVAISRYFGPKNSLEPPFTSLPLRQGKRTLSPFIARSPGPAFLVNLTTRYSLTSASEPSLRELPKFVRDPFSHLVCTHCPPLVTSISLSLILCCLLRRRRYPPVVFRVEGG